MPPRKRTAIRERKERQAEKQRLEEMKAKMSAKKLQRLKKVRFPSLAKLHRLICSAWAGPRRSTNDLVRCGRLLHFILLNFPPTRQCCTTCTSTRLLHPSSLTVNQSPSSPTSQGKQIPPRA